MNARPPCLASRDADALAALQGKYDAEDAALDAYTREHYGPPFDSPEFIEEALKEAPFMLTAAIAGTTDDATIGRQVKVWLGIFAESRARRDMQEARNAA